MLYIILLVIYIYIQLSVYIYICKFTTYYTIGVYIVLTYLGHPLVPQGSKKDANEAVLNTILVTTDSQLPVAEDHTETLQLCSPSQLLNTSTAMETLSKMDEHEKAREAQVPGYMKQCCVQFNCRGRYPNRLTFNQSIWFDQSTVYL